MVLPVVVVVGPGVWAMQVVSWQAELAKQGGQDERWFGKGKQRKVLGEPFADPPGTSAGSGSLGSTGLFGSRRMSTSLAGSPALLWMTMIPMAPSSMFSMSQIE